MCFLHREPPPASHLMRNTPPHLLFFAYLPVHPPKLHTTTWKGGQRRAIHSTQPLFLLTSLHGVTHLLRTTNTFTQHSLTWRNLIPALHR
ncbi:hypothetical protein CHARACLAT_020861 [Characodon lateralis]|uniref:Uncharacterized protein n=1 Tax=Characodon lateralis TaxID=208331 RepID=A0ABU7CPY1_9TELE|nr:hypothetical protein [Characodon lateralis]